MWPLSDPEYAARQIASRRVTRLPRPCDCVACTLVRNFDLLALSDRPRPGETIEEWRQVQREAAESVARRLHLDIHIRG